MSYYEIPIKCMACSLHFKIYSDHKEREPRVVFCPECGVKGSKIVFGANEKDGFIFEAVPGTAIGAESLQIG